uniref:Uncharacterized protein n=1 Tax=Glossina palpalis gambiensis TaxID=67801 RepID=A0A1B0AS34_9MUSC
MNKKATNLSNQQKISERSNSNKEFVNAGTNNRESTFLLRLSNKDFVYIIQTDQKYHNALTDTTNHSMIALIIEPVESCRNNKTSVIAITTATNIFIFDILYLGKVYLDFGRILEAKYLCKIVHSSRSIADYLQHLMTTLRSLEETIQNTLYPETEETERNPFKPYKRSLANAWLSLVAKKALLQLKLKKL